MLIGGISHNWERTAMITSNLLIVLPAFNEQGNLPSLIGNLESALEHLRRLGHERAYVVVDDGSTDRTCEILEEFRRDLPMTIIRHQTNQGLGQTIRDGLRQASELASDQDVVLAMDADNTHPAGLLIRMTQMILEGNDIVIASRYRPGARVVGLSAHRRLMSYGARMLFRLVLPIRGVRDYTCGYRAYRAALLKKAFRVYGDALVRKRGFQCMSELLIRLNALSPVITEVPMILRYDNKKGDSKMRVVQTVVGTLKLMVECRLQKMPSSTVKAD